MANKLLCNLFGKEMFGNLIVMTLVPHQSLSSVHATGTAILNVPYQGTKKRGQQRAHVSADDKFAT